MAGEPEGLTEGLAEDLAEDLAERLTSPRHDGEAVAPDGSAPDFAGLAAPAASPRHDANPDGASAAHGAAVLAALEQAAGDRPMPWPALAAAVRIRATADDFFVEELPAFDPEERGAGDESGEHFWVEIEKCGENTDTVARVLAKAVGVREVDVGFAGRKDRHARTRQWFSLRWPHAARPWRMGDRSASETGAVDAADTPPRTRTAQHADARDLCGEALATLNATLIAAFSPDTTGTTAVALRGHWYHRKLQTGYLAGNRFRIVFELRSGAPGSASLDALPSPAEVNARLRDIAKRGLPNYFGAQRFGRRNLLEGVKRLNRGEGLTASTGGSRRPPRTARGRRDRTQDSLAWSALRSAVFNAVLAARVRDGTWATLVPGERVQLDGSGSFFVWAPDGASAAERATLMQRCERGDVHPSGPLPGRQRASDGGASDAGAAPEIEARVLGTFTPVVAGLAARGLDAARRPLRLWVRGLEGRVLDAESGRYAWSFELPPGAFATTVIEALAPVEDLARDVASAARSGD